MIAAYFTDLHGGLGILLTGGTIVVCIGIALWRSYHDV